MSRLLNIALFAFLASAPPGAQVASEPDPGWIKPDERATHDYLRTQLPQAAETSSDPYVLLVGAATAGFDRTASRDTEWFLAQAHALVPGDPLVLWRIAGYCRDRAGAASWLCDDKDWFEHLANADPGNAAAMLYAAQEAARNRDTGTVRELLSEAARLPYFGGYRDEHIVAAYHALHSLSLPGQELDPFTVAVYAAKLSTGLPEPVSALMQACDSLRGDEDASGDCATLARLALDGPLTTHSAISAARMVLSSEPDDDERDRLEALMETARTLEAEMREFDERFHGDRALLEKFLSDLTVHGEMDAYRRVLNTVN